MSRVTDRLRRRTETDNGNGSAGTHTKSTATGLIVREGEHYPRMDAASVHELAGKAGPGRFHDPESWGENAQEAPALNMLEHEITKDRALVGHHLNGQLTGISDSIELLRGKLRAVIPRAADALEAWWETAVAGAQLEARAQESGLPTSEVSRGYSYYLILLGITLGDLTFVATCFQVMGLSAKLALGWIPLSSPLYLAASTSVVALLMLAHFSGIFLRGALGSLERRSHTRASGADQIPPFSWTSVVALLGLLAGTAGVLYGVASVRAGYLAARHQQTYFDAWLAIQAAVFIAASAFSYYHAHPSTSEHGQSWLDEYSAGRTRVTEAQQKLDEVFTEMTELSANERAQHHQIRNVIAQAVQYAALGEAEIRRLGWLYQFEARVSSEEQLARMFPDESRPMLPSYAQEELMRMLLTTAELPALGDPIDLTPILEERDSRRTDLRRLRRQLGLEPTIDSGDATDEEQTLA